MQLYHLVTPGGHKRRMTTRDSVDDGFDMEKKLISEKRTLWRHTCDFVALITHAVNIGGAAKIHTSFHSLIMVIC